MGDYAEDRRFLIALGYKLDAKGLKELRDKYGTLAGAVKAIGGIDKFSEYRAQKNEAVIEGVYGLTPEEQQQMIAQREAAKAEGNYTYVAKYIKEVETQGISEETAQQLDKEGYTAGDVLRGIRQARDNDMERPLFDITGRGSTLYIGLPKNIQVSKQVKKPTEQNSNNLPVGDYLRNRSRDFTENNTNQPSQVPKYATKESQEPVSIYLQNRALNYVRSSEFKNFKPSPPKLFYEEVGNVALDYTKSAIRGYYKIGKEIVFPINSGLVYTEAGLMAYDIFKNRKNKTYVEQSKENIKNNIIGTGLTLAKDKDVQLASTLSLGFGISMIPVVNIVAGSAFAFQITENVIENPSKETFGELVFLGGLGAVGYGVSKTPTVYKYLKSKINGKDVFRFNYESKINQNNDYFEFKEPESILTTRNEELNVYNVNFKRKSGQKTLLGETAQENKIYSVFFKEESNPIAQFSTKEEATSFINNREGFKIYWRKNNVKNELGFGKFNPQAQEYIEGNSLKTTPSFIERSTKQTELKTEISTSLIKKDKTTGAELYFKYNSEDQIIFYNQKTNNFDILPRSDFIKYSKNKLPKRTESGQSAGGVVFPFRTINAKDRLFSSTQNLLNPSYNVVRKVNNKSVLDYLPQNKKKGKIKQNGKTKYIKSQSIEDTYNYNTAFDKLSNVKILAEIKDIRVTKQNRLIKSKGGFDNIANYNDAFFKLEELKNPLSLTKDNLKIRQQSNRRTGQSKSFESVANYKDAFFKLEELKNPLSLTKDNLKIRQETQRKKQYGAFSKNYENYDEAVATLWTIKNIKKPTTKKTNSIKFKLGEVEPKIKQIESKNELSVSESKTDQLLILEKPKTTTRKTNKIKRSEPIKKKSEPPPYDLTPPTPNNEYNFNDIISGAFTQSDTLSLELITKGNFKTISPNKKSQTPNFIIFSGKKIENSTKINSFSNNIKTNIKSNNILNIQQINNIRTNTRRALLNQNTNIKQKSSTFFKNNNRLSQSSIQTQSKIQSPLQTQTPIQTIKQIQTPNTPKTPFLPREPNKPRKPLPDDPFKPKKIPNVDLFKRQKRESGFFVQVKRRGIFKTASSEPLTEQEAIKLGSVLVGKSSAASFKLIPTGGLVSNKKIRTEVKDDISTLYRKQSKSGTVFIEKNKFRINTGGEVKEITFAPRKNRGFF